MNCFSTPEERRAKQVNRQIQTDLLENERKDLRKLRIPVLLLGKSGSGKSTIVKSLRISHGEPFTPEERVEYRLLVYQSLYMAVRSLIDAMDFLLIEYEKRPREEEIIKFIELDSQNPPQQLPVEHYLFIKNFWKDKGVRECFKRKNTFQISDSADYFLSNLDRINEADYVPSNDDILRVRDRNVGMREYSLRIRGVTYDVIDIGEQKGLQRKWYPFFDRIKCIVFVVAMNEYDQELQEMEEYKKGLFLSLKLFEKIVNCQYFQDASILLYLNKLDLLALKILSSHLGDFLPYEGPKLDVESAATSIREMFMAMGRNRTDIYSHFSCATDTHGINSNFFFHSILNSFIEKNLKNENVF